MAGTNKEYTANSTDNVSSTKGVRGGYIFVAPVGTTLPTDYSTALPTAYKCLGFISEDGYVETVDSDSEDLVDMNGDLMDSPQTSRVESAQLTLAEIKAMTLKLMYGDENVTDKAGVITVKHNGNSNGTWVVVLDLLLKNNRKWRKVVPLFQCSELDDLTLAVGELAARALTAKYLTDGDGNTCYDYIQSTETKLKYVGVVVIDNATKKIESNELIQLDGYANEDADTKAAADAIITDVDARLGAVFAKSEVELNGKRDPGVRTQETNLGDLITDALLWYATKDGKLDVPADHIVAVTNGGGIRASIKAGDITMKDINTVLPFGNTVAVVYISGEKLLESLEAATQSAPTALGGFPQIAGINLSLCTGAAYDKQDETYPGGSTYYGPKSINRVTINSINGKPFRAKDTYAVVTNDFMAAGGDVYYAFASSPKIVDTGTPMDEALVEFIKVKLNGVIGKEYENAQGRLNMAVFNDVPNNIWYTKAVNYVAEKSLMNGTGASFKPMDSTSRAMLVTVLYRMAGSPEVEGKVSETFKDCVDGSYYANAVLWASQNNIVNGYGDSFKPNQAVTRQEMAKILYGYDKVMEKAGETFAVQLTYTDLDSIAGWALEGVNYCTAAGYLSGSNNAFSPKGNATRAMTAQVLMNMTAEKEAA